MKDAKKEIRRVDANVEIKRMTASERDGMIQLAIMGDLVDSISKLLGQRTSKIKMARSRIGIMRWAAETLLNDMMFSIPVEQLKGFARNMKMRSYTIGVRSPHSGHIRDKEYGLFLTWEEAGALVKGCHDHCMMCQLNPAEQRACILKKAMDTMGNDVPDKPDGSCPYYGEI